MLATADWSLQWILAAISAGGAAYFGAYLRTRAERRAIKESLDAVERRVADITEAARVRWSRQSEVWATLHGRLISAQREFEEFLWGSTTTSAERVDELGKRCRALDDYLAENKLFLPKGIAGQVGQVAKEFGRVYNTTTVPRPGRADAEGGGPESAEQSEIRKHHYGMKAKALERFKEDGDLTIAIARIEESLRASLEAPPAR